MASVQRFDLGPVLQRTAPSARLLDAEPLAHQIMPAPNPAPLASGRGPIRVLVVDDSALVRAALRKELGAHPQIEVVGTASDPFVARDLIQQLDPEVLVLDLEMPRMDGLSFLRRLMAFHPLPVIVCSSLSPQGSEMALSCLEAGAIEVFGKPSAAYSIGDLGGDLIRTVLQARRVRLQPKQPVGRGSKSQGTALSVTTNKAILVGASTGGGSAIHAILSNLPANMPGIVIVQHMPASFSAAFAKRMDAASVLEVREAKSGDLIGPGKVLVAPGDVHLKVVRSGAQYLVETQAGPRVRYHRPAVEVLFESGAQVLGPNAMGLILTGMGNDGAGGMASLHAAGGFTVAQDESSSVIFGMPREAIAAGGVDEVLHLDAIPARMVDFARGQARRKSVG